MRKPLPAAPPAPPGSLAAAPATVPDPRRPYGWRPDCPPLPLVGLLQLAVAAMLGGARSLYAVAQWGRERREEDPAALAPLGLPPGRSPCVATLHRVFKALDVAAFEQALGAWLAAGGGAPTDALAGDGKTRRGIHGDAVPGVHLVAAFAHQAGAVLGQVASPGKGHELAAAKTRLGTVPLAGRPVTGDALLTQRAVWIQIVAAGGDDLFPVDANQPALLAAVAAAFSPLGRAGGGRVGAADGAVVAARGAEAAGRGDDGGDAGRPEGAPRPAGARPVWAMADPALNGCVGEAGAHEAPWPHVAQVRRIRRERINVPTGEIAEEVTYAITSLPPARADARRLLTLLRGHWRIENQLHWVRDVTLGEDRSAIRTGAAPQAVAACRNLVLALRRRAGQPAIAAALRTDAGRPTTAISLVAAASIKVMK